MTFTDEYTIVNATRDDIHAMLAFLEDDFLHNEPLNASLQLTADETRDFFIGMFHVYSTQKNFAGPGHFLTTFGIIF